MTTKHTTTITLTTLALAAGVALTGCEAISSDLAGDHEGTVGEESVVPAHGLAEAKQELSELTVKGKAPMTGYDRETKFGPAWKDLDRNGCDTRNDVLARDLNQIEYKPGTRDCVVASGQLDPEPYTGQSIDFVRGPDSSKVQIDHLVALGNVWVSGGQQLTQDQREAIANDPENLLAVDGPANGAKQDKNAAEWLPPAKDYRCSYVAGQIQVKTKYSLSITSAEKAAMDRILTSCTN